MAADTWKDGGGNWTVSIDWSNGVPMATSNVVVAQGDPQITAPIAIASLNVSAAVTFINAGASSISGALTNSGTFNLDAGSGDGGSSLTVGGVLTNTGVVQLGAADNTLSKSDIVKVQSLVDTIGQIVLDGGVPTSGGQSGAGRMTLDVTGGVAGFGTAGVLSSDIDLSGQATIEFASGQITTIQNLATLSLTGAAAFVADASATTSNSALTGLNLVAGTLALKNGAKIATSGALNNINMVEISSIVGQHTSALTIGGALTNNGEIDLDTGGGGSTLTVNGVLTNNQAMFLGSGSLTQSSTVTAKGLVNVGELSLSAGSPRASLMLLNVTGGVAGFGTAGVLSGDVKLSGNAAIRFASGQINTIASLGTLELDGLTARIADAAAPASNSALTGLSSVAGSLFLNSGAALSTSGSLTIASFGDVEVDSSFKLGGEGGSIFTVGGALIDNGALRIGSSQNDLTGSDQVAAKSLSLGGTSILELDGNVSAPEQALLRVTTGLAGFGSTGVLNGDVTLSGDAAIQFVSGQIATIASAGSLNLDGPSAFIADGAVNANNALTGLANVAGTLNVADGATISTSGALNNTGSIGLDHQRGAGGSSLTVGGVLANRSGFFLGGGASLTRSDTVTAKGLVNQGTVDLNGGATAGSRALLDITGVAGFGIAGVLSGIVSLSGDAQIEFASGQIATIGSGSALELFGPNATIADAATPSSNSALTGLTSVAGVLELANGAALTTSGSLKITNGVGIDSPAFHVAQGGSSLTIGGVLTNNSVLFIGNNAITAADTVKAAGLVNTAELQLKGGATTAARAMLDITGGVAGFGTAGALSGSVSLSGESAIEFASGQITTIQSGASLILDGPNAFIADAAALTSNSALTGLASVAGTLTLSNGAKIVTSGALTNGGPIQIDGNFFSGVGGGAGGSSLTIGGVLTNKGGLAIGNNSIAQSVAVQATGIVNQGGVVVAGSATTATRALLRVTGVAGFGTAGALTSSVDISGDAAIEFASGQITSIADAASLMLTGANAFIADGTSNSNNALAGLSTIAGTLQLEDGAKITTTGALTVTGTGNLQIDTDSIAGFGSSLTVGGVLTNDSFQTSFGAASMTTSDTVTAVGLANQGSLQLDGGATASERMLVNVTGGVAGFGTAGVLSGDVFLSGQSKIEFASGQITSIASSGNLTLNGPNAFIADGVSLSNNALAGLTNLAGEFNLQNGAKVTTTGPLTNGGILNIDQSFDAGGSSLTIGGVLTNNSGVMVGNSSMTAAATLTAASFVNNDFIDLFGNGARHGSLSVTGAVTNNGAFNLFGDSETLASAVGGTGTFFVRANVFNASSTLDFESSVASGQSIDFSGADALVLANGKTFAASINDFGGGDSLDVKNFATGTTFNFVENGANTGGVLTLTNGANVAHLAFNGVYTNADFSLTASAAGSLIKFV